MKSGQGRCSGARSISRIERLENRTLYAIGELDPTFGVGGAVDVGQQGYQVVTAQPDGKLLLCTHAGLLRLNVDGSVDGSFGVSGHAADPGFQPVDSKMLPSGEIAVAGTVNKSLAVAVYRTDGSLDPAFGTNGVTIIAPPQGLELGASGLAVQSSGKIVVVGEEDNLDTVSRFAGGFSEMYFTRFNASGTIDTGYGQSGVVTLGSVFGVGNVTLLADDSVYASGTLTHSGNQELDAQYIVVNRDGSGQPNVGGPISGLLAGYGHAAGLSGGQLVYSDGYDETSFLNLAGPTARQIRGIYVGALVPTADDKFLVLSAASIGGEAQVSRYNADLTLDGTFALGGFRTFSTPYGFDAATLLPDGDVALVGYDPSGITPTYNLTVTRIHLDSAAAAGPTAISATVVPPKIGKRWAYATVTYMAGQNPLDASTLASQAVQVSTPAGTRSTIAQANLVSSTANANTLQAVYAFAVPGNHLTRADNGTYTVIVGAAAIKDTATIANVGGPLAAYTIYVPRRNRGTAAVVATQVPTNELLLSDGPVTTATAASRRRGRRVFE